MGQLQQEMPRELTVLDGSPNPKGAPGRVKEIQNGGSCPSTPDRLRVALRVSRHRTYIRIGNGCGWLRISVSPILSA